MKKLVFILISIFIISALPFGCGKQVQKGELSFCAPDGAPALSIAKLIGDKEDFGTGATVSYSVLSAVEISTAITVKKADFVILPVLAATKLYKAGESYKMVAVVTHGNFYFDSSFKIESVSDLVGKVVYIPQNRDTVPDITLKSILKKENIIYEEGDSPVSGKIVLCYKGSGANVIGAMPKDGSESAVAYLPEPAATNLSVKKPAYSYTADVQEFYDKEEKSYPQAVLMVKASTLNAYPQIVEKLKTAIEQNSEYIKEQTAQAISTIKDNFSASELPQTISVKSINGCKIYWGSASNEKQAVINYIQRAKEILENSANSVTDEFFY